MKEREGERKRESRSEKEGRNRRVRITDSRKGREKGIERGNE